MIDISAGWLLVLECSKPDWKDTKRTFKLVSQTHIDNAMAKEKKNDQRQTAVCISQLRPQKDTELQEPHNKPRIISGAPEIYPDQHVIPVVSSFLIIKKKKQIL